MLYLEVMSLEEAFRRPDFIERPDATFANGFNQQWLEDDFAWRVISDVDQIPMQGGSVMESLIMQGLSPLNLCMGTKNLIVCKQIDGYLNRLSFMGENCYKYLMDIADMKDVDMAVTAPVQFSDEDIRGRPIVFTNFNRIVQTAEDFMLTIEECREWF